MVRKRIVPLAALALLFALLLPLAGCGSADQEAYFREMREINEELTARLEALEEEAGEADRSGRLEPGEGLAEVLEEMAAALEEGVVEMSRVKVPAGGEEAHLSLLKLLSGAARGYRDAASALSPHAAEEEGADDLEEGGTSPEESEGHPAGETEEESQQPLAPSGQTGSTSSH